MFRGQRRLSWRLESSLERALPNGAERPKAEQSLRFRFGQVVANYLPAGQIPQHRFDWLATMQHHGTPTRLLDFTRSPYVAAYFAIEDASADEPCAIWAISESWCRAQADRVLLAANLSGEPYPTYSWLYRAKELNKASLVAPAGPMQLSTRQIAQQALFAVPGDVSLPFEENLRAMLEPKEDIGQHVKCYQIDGSTRGEVLRDLRLMNISRASLYPGLDGFAQSLRYELVDEDVGRWAVRAAVRGNSDLSF
nr:FRG domain-containing protein [Luteitalea sp.]